MKTVRKLAALLIALVVCLGFSVAAFGATITVENSDPGTDLDQRREEYTAYKIFDAVKANGTTINTDGVVQTATGPITYKINKTNDWFDVLFNEDEYFTPKEGNIWFTVASIPGEADTFQVIPAAGFTADAEDAETQAKAAAAWLLANKGDITGIPLQIGENTVDDGYYLITSSLGTNLGLATTDIPMEIVEKNTYPTIDKKQNDVSADGTYADTKLNVAVGDTIWYSVDVVIPASAKGDIVVTDTMTAGLTYDSTAGLAWSVSGDGTIAADEGETKNDYKVETTPENAAWKVTIHATDNTRGKTVTIKYAATVNASAVGTDLTRKNEAVLEYSHFSMKDEVLYTIYATGAIKFDGATVKKNGDALVLDDTGNIQQKDTETAIKYLASAEFELYAGDTQVKVSKHNDGYYYPDTEGTEKITSDANGQIIIRGLDSDKTYTLKETKAPNGYNLMSGNTTELSLAVDTKANVAITAGEAEDTTYLAAANVLKIENKQGSLLPATGGIGTTIFIIAGGVIVAAAVVLLIAKKRAGSRK